MGAGEAIIVLFLLIIELVMWFFLFLFEIFLALIQRRKPKKIKKPIIWRKKKVKKNESEELE